MKRTLCVSKNQGQKSLKKRKKKSSKDSGFNWTWAFIGPWHENSRLGPRVESLCQTQTGHGTLNFYQAQTNAHVGVAEVFVYISWVSKCKELYDNNIDALNSYHWWEYWIIQTWRCKKSYLWRLSWLKGQGHGPNFTSAMVIYAHGLDRSHQNYIHIRSIKIIIMLLRPKTYIIYNTWM